MLVVTSRVHGEIQRPTSPKAHGVSLQTRSFGKPRTSRSYTPTLACLLVWYIWQH